MLSVLLQHGSKRRRMQPDRSSTDIAIHLLTLLKVQQWIFDSASWTPFRRQRGLGDRLGRRNLSTSIDLLDCESGEVGIRCEQKPALD